jgi:dephospho-CoA kinase
MAAQIPDQEKAGRCDYVIDNTGSLEETRTVVEGDLPRAGAGSQ